MEERVNVLALLSHVSHEEKSLFCKHDVADVFAVCQKQAARSPLGSSGGIASPLYPPLLLNAYEHALGPPFLLHEEPFTHRHNMAHAMESGQSIVDWLVADWQVMNGDNNL